MPLFWPISGMVSYRWYTVEYNLIERTPDRDLLPMAQAHGLGVAFWSPLAGGTLTGKYRTASTDKDNRQTAWGGLLVKAKAAAVKRVSLMHWLILPIHIRQRCCTLHSHGYVNVINLKNCLP
ncbi:aldo/keto reductase [Chitinophaga pinensis]|uniref:aldo/keto reductase n=1 Tax=Chitinophaga pinensis TaxID=79329 RepID=UPI001C99A28C|nr:aldo/keto reductase [Chitinophaga pinensis]